MPKNLETQSVFIEFITPKINLPLLNTYKTPDVLYWENGTKKNFVALPYIPYFTSCEGYGRNICFNFFI